MEVEIRDAAADLKAYKYRRRSPRSPTQKESKKDLYLFFSILLRE